MRPNQIMTHIPELEKAMNEALTEKWAELRGLEVVSIALGSVTLPKEDEQLIKELQRKAVIATNPNMAGATLFEAQAEAKKAGGANPNGAAMGFFGMGMAQNAGGMHAQQFYSMGQQQQAQQQAQQQTQQPQQNGWKCPQCGKIATGKFCPECGAKKPEVDEWICPNCKTKTSGKFCPECGAKKPEAKKVFKCNKCGWTPEDPSNPPKFCPECGDRFDDEDAK